MYIQTNFIFDYNYYIVYIHIIEKQFIFLLTNNKKTFKPLLNLVFNYNPTQSLTLLMASLLVKEITAKHIDYYKVKRPLNSFNTKRHLKICGSILFSWVESLQLLNVIKNNFIYVQRHILYLFSRTELFSDFVFLIENLLDFSSINKYYTSWINILPQVKPIVQLNIICNHNNFMHIFLVFT